MIAMTQQIKNRIPRNNNNLTRHNRLETFRDSNEQRRELCLKAKFESATFRCLA